MQTKMHLFRQYLSAIAADDDGVLEVGAGLGIGGQDGPLIFRGLDAGRPHVDHRLDGISASPVPVNLIRPERCILNILCREKIIESWDEMKNRIDTCIFTCQRNDNKTWLIFAKRIEVVVLPFTLVYRKWSIMIASDSPFRNWI
jgi:hypothetical protein